jgi:ferredoxin
LLAAATGKSTILVAGCKGCVAVCGAGGEREVGLLATQLELAAKRLGQKRTVIRATVARQCDPGFLPPFDNLMEQAQACFSLGCGVGVQYMAERYPGKPVFPAVDTVFAGGSPAAGHWEERCRMCGECVLGETGGICPVSRCAKELLNGPCGGSVNGRCEIGRDQPCAWNLIYERLSGQGRLKNLNVITPPKDWSRAGAGVRSVAREDLMP